jgi:hypothetical protein
LPTIDQLGLPSGDGTQEIAESYTIIEAKLLIPHPDEWGGAYVDGDYLVVNTVTRSTRDATKLLEALNLSAPIRVEAVPFSMAELADVTDALAGDPALAGSYASIGPDYSHSRVVVGLLTGDDARDPGATPQLGSLAITETGDSRGAVPIATYDGGTPQSTSRYFDSSPFYGGDNLHFSGNGGNGCSGAFTWANGSTKYLVSASHCARTATVSRNSVYKVDVSNTSTITDDTYTRIGTVVWTSGGLNGTVSGRHGDLSVIKLNSGLGVSARVFVGTYNTITTRTVIGSQSLPQGLKPTTLRSSGAGPYYGNGDGEIAPTWISLVNQTVTYNNNGQTYKNLTVAEDSANCFEPGDSGGAVYMQSGSSNAYAVGVISGDNGQGAGPTNCRNYYTPIGYVTGDFGGNLVIQ